MAKKKIVSVEERLAKEAAAETKTTDTISEENMKAVSETMKSLRDQSPELKILAELPSNNGVEEVSGSTEKGETMEAEVRINPKTGERAVIGPAAKVSEDDKFETDEDVDLPDPEPYDHDKFIRSITLEDISKLPEAVGVKEMLGDLKLEDGDAIQLMQVLNRYQAKEDFNLYHAFPTSVQKAVDAVCGRNGFVGKNPQANYARNMFCEMVMNQFISDIGMQKAISDFNDEIESIMDNLNEDYSKMWYDYSSKRDEYLQKAVEKIEDPDKRNELIAILDSMADGLELKRLKEAIKDRKLWLKKFEKEKPSKLFDKFLFQFEQSTYNIYSVYTAAQTLNRHLPEKYTGEDCMNFLALFCKFCINNGYKAENPIQNAFMYYVPYNCVLLDKYRNEQYEAFYAKFVTNVMEVIDLMKA